MSLSLQIGLTILGPVLANLILLCALWVFKIPTLIKEHTTTLKTLSGAVKDLVDAVEHLQKRHGVVDRILSDVAGQPIDTETIAKDGLKYPMIKQRRDS